MVEVFYYLQLCKFFQNCYDVEYYKYLWYFFLNLCEVFKVFLNKTDIKKRTE